MVLACGTACCDVIVEFGLVLPSSMHRGLSSHLNVSGDLWRHRSLVTSAWDWSSPSISLHRGLSSHLNVNGAVYDVIGHNWCRRRLVRVLTSQWQSSCLEVAPIGHLPVTGVCHLISRLRGGVCVSSRLLGVVMGRFDSIWGIISSSHGNIWLTMYRSRL